MSCCAVLPMNHHADPCVTPQRTWSALSGSPATAAMGLEKREVPLADLAEPAGVLTTYACAYPDRLQVATRRSIFPVVGGTFACDDDVASTP